VSARRTLAISRRIADLFRRDHRTLALLFVAPIVILALLGWVIRDQQLPPTRLAIINEAGAVGETVVGQLADAVAEAGMTVDERVTTKEQARAALGDGELDVAVVLEAEAAPTVRLITPGVQLSDDAARVAELRQTLLDSFDVPRIGVEHETVYGTSDAGFLDTFAPALVGFLVFFLVFVLTGVSFLRERMGGTLERLLGTPVRRSEIVVGYSLGFSIFATLQVALVLLYTLSSIEIPAIGPFASFTIGLGVVNAGSAGLAFLVTLLLAVTAVNLGIFVSTFARTELQVLQFIPIVIVPQALLAGIFWPVDALPGILQPISLLLPMTYGIDGLREVLIKGSDLATPALQLDLLVLAGMTGLMVLLATATIRREVA